MIDINEFKPPEGYVLAACRLCGELWFIPEQYADQFDADHGFECSKCRAIKIVRKYKPI